MKYKDFLNNNLTDYQDLVVLILASWLDSYIKQNISRCISVFSRSLCIKQTIQRQNYISDQFPSNRRERGVCVCVCYWGRKRPLKQAAVTVLTLWRAEKFVL